jgi:hypothetical protein
LSRLVPIRPDAVLTVSAAAVWADVGDETAILDTAAGEYFGVQAGGARVWQLLQEPVRMAELCDRIAAEYDVERTRCEADLEEFITALVADGLVRIE